MHSFHLHGHSFYVVGMGNGTFDEKNDVGTYNLVNPVRRDTLALLPLGWTAFRFRANNPGVWSYHCTQVGIFFDMNVIFDLMYSLQSSRFMIRSHFLFHFVLSSPLI